MKLNMPSTLSLVSLISVVMGAIVFCISALYLDAVVKLRNSDNFAPFCPTPDPNPLLLDLCKITRHWMICAALALVLGLLQIIFGGVGIRLMESRWKLWCGAHIFIFVLMISVFSWGAREDVDDNMADKVAAFDLKTQAKGQAFLALAGLDFIYLFAAIIFVLVFARNNSSCSYYDS